ncbi:MAG: pyrroline-5-carboxylate reductase [Chthoniobacterales bacterium]
MSPRLGFIGAGKLAGSVIRGLLLAKYCAPQEIVASQPLDNLRLELQEETGVRVTAHNADVVDNAQIIFIGVKPAVVTGIISESSASLRGKLVISLAAGIRLASMEERSEARFLRVLTNTPSAIARGASAFAPGSRTTPEDIAMVKEIFGAIGVVVQVDEEQIDAVTGLSGSGPAFVYSVIEALAEGGKKCGLPEDVALTLATQTVLGAAQLAASSNASPEELRQMVITPGGTTAAGLAAMEKLGTREGLIAAVEAATARGREMIAG